MHYYYRSIFTPFTLQGYCCVGEHLPGWHVVSPHDPVVKDAANHAVQAIQERSNSLFPYELVEILQSKAEVKKSCLSDLFSEQFLWMENEMEFCLIASR